MRSLVLLLGLAGLAACSDVRDYEGAWAGPRRGDAPVLDVGVADAATASMAIAGIDTHGITGTLTVTGLVTGASFTSISGAEADVLSSISFDGSPARVYLAFFDVPDGGGAALAVIALYDPDRVELRVLRGGAQPLYGIFSLARPGDAGAPQGSST